MHCLCRSLCPSVKGIHRNCQDKYANECSCKLGVIMKKIDYDVLVIGAGIGGIQTAIDLGDKGHSVLMIDRRESIGGAMIQLSKVFPTLDCGSCITTPKMSEAFNHEMVTTMTFAEFKSFKSNGDDTFDVEILQKSRF